MCVCTLHHAPVGRVCDGVDVWGHLMSFLALVHIYDLLGVDGQVLVGVDDHTEQARIRLWRTECQSQPEHIHTHTQHEQQSKIWGHVLPCVTPKSVN